MSSQDIKSTADAKTFLRGVGLNVEEHVVRAIVSRLMDGGSLFHLYTSGQDRLGHERTAIVAKTTTTKVRKLYMAGKLQPYQDYLARLEPPPRQDATETQQAARTQDVLEAWKKHRQDVIGAAREFSKAFYYVGEDGDSNFFPTSFPSEFAGVGGHKAGHLEWIVNAAGTVSVSFDVERLALFDALHGHLPARVWVIFEEIKTDLVGALMRARSIGAPADAVHVNKRVRELHELLEPFILRGILPGRCRFCPE